MKWIFGIFAATIGILVSAISMPATAQDAPFQLASADGLVNEFPTATPVAVIAVNIADLEALDEVLIKDSTTRIGPQIQAPADDVRLVRENGKTFITKGEAIRLEVVFQALNVLDWATTKYCLDRGTCDEGNPFWGKDPDMTKMALVKLGVGALHAAYMYFLYENAPSLYKPFAYGSIAIYGGVVAWNLQFAF